MSAEKPANGKHEVKPGKELVDSSASKEEKPKDDAADKVVPYLSLYRGIDGNDYIAIFLGLIGSFVNGLTFPAFSFVFAEVRQSHLLTMRTLFCSQGGRLNSIRWKGLGV